MSEVPAIYKRLEAQYNELLKRIELLEQTDTNFGAATPYVINLRDRNKALQLENEDHKNYISSLLKENEKLNRKIDSYKAQLSKVQKELNSLKELKENYAKVMKSLKEAE